ncbi:MAG TPA: adenylate/guanylate cyclase domain-containing protein [Nevskiaceae bacterium]|nr:adenylate/guanylate cyclase domain-containing protein [Nevskiaceae bacterium]
MTELPIESMSQVAYDLLVLGVAWAFMNADRDSPANRALAGALFLLGADQLMDYWLVVLGVDHPSPIWLYALHSEVFAGAAAAEWLRRVIRTIPAPDGLTRFADRLLVLAQVLWLLHVVYRMVFAHQLYIELQAADPSHLAIAAGFWNERWNELGTASLLAPVLILIFRFRQADSHEVVRLLGFALAVPFFLLSLAFDEEPQLYLTLRIIAVLMLFITAMKFHLMQGRRGEFLSRFLSPQVGQLVNERGLREALKQNQLEISVICIDLRGFTAYSQVHSSDRVVGVLTDYYNAVCAQVSRYAGTVKDFAGDGILILMGAPLCVESHAARALELARASLDATRKSIASWSSPQAQLGVGVGVATGVVTVGVIDAASRMEYAAVGPAVNLACRLCSQAHDGEILVDARTAEITQTASLEHRGTVNVKGMGEVPHFLLAPT